MQKTITSLYLKEPGTIFSIVDEELLEKMPSLREQSLIFSVIKKSGPYLMLQYTGPKGSGRLKLIKDYKIEIQGESKTPTLSSLIGKYKYRSDKPKKVKLNGNGVAAEYGVTLEFWEQNPNNIRLKGLQRFGTKYKIPGAFLVLEEKFD